jgi:hypothetical protein
MKLYVCAAAVCCRCGCTRAEHVKVGTGDLEIGAENAATVKEPMTSRILTGRVKGPEEGYPCVLGFGIHSYTFQAPVSGKQCICPYCIRTKLQS